jgi:hypothetical protein
MRPNCVVASFRKSGGTCAGEWDRGGAPCLNISPLACHSTRAKNARSASSLTGAMPLPIGLSPLRQQGVALLAALEIISASLPHQPQFALSVTTPQETPRLRPRHVSNCGERAEYGAPHLARSHIPG